VIKRPASASASNCRAIPNDVSTDLESYWVLELCNQGYVALLSALDASGVGGL
jgi:hypothetical protein